MTDARLRELERRWRTSGGVEDEALYLAERTRAGEVSAERLALAATLGHAAARLAAPDAPAPLDGQQLVKAVSTCGIEALVRAQIDVARETIARLAWQLDRPPQAHIDAADHAVRAAERWVLCPCATCVRDALVQADQSMIGAMRFAGLQRARQAALMVRSKTLREARRHAGFGVHDVPTLARELVPWLLGLEDPIAGRHAE